MRKRVLSELLLLGGVIICVLFLVGIQHILQRQSVKHVKVLVLGDSIWDLVRDETGVAARLEESLDGAEIYNLAIQGSQAACTNRETDVDSLVAMTAYITGERNCMLSEQVYAQKLLAEVPYEELDYVILAYGLNDYFGAVKQKNPEDFFDETTYSGALCSSIQKLRQKCPRAVFVIASPTYCQGYSYGKVVHESISYDFGGGTVLDYTASARAVAASFDGIFINNLEDMNLSIHNGRRYLVDATHLTEDGRKRYAENVAIYLAKDMEQR